MHTGNFPHLLTVVSGPARSDVCMDKESPFSVCLSPLRSARAGLKCYFFSEVFFFATAPMPLTASELYSSLPLFNMSHEHCGV